MENNRLEGSITSTLGNCQNLQIGSLPYEVGDLANLMELDVSETSYQALWWHLIIASTCMPQGSFGSLYKGVIPRDGTIVSVKVLNLQQGAFKSFIDERKALRSIRHRNLLKILTACSSIDNLGNEFKSLVFKYMENGSLVLEVLVAEGCD
ncbi:unnamed protein product [Prunus armeniaca]